METEDRYAAFRPQRLPHPFRIIGWAMVARGLIAVSFGFFAIVSLSHALKQGDFATVGTLLGFGFGFVLWGARAINRGTAIAIRFRVRPSAPSDLADRVDPHTGEAIGYGQRAYQIQNLRYFFLRKELPNVQQGDIIDELLSMFGQRSQPLHPDKRELITDILRGAVASFALLAAFTAAFGYAQFDPAMQNQRALMNLVFLAAFLFILKYWGFTPEAQTARRKLSLANLLWQMAAITLVAVVLPVILGMLGPVAALFSRIDVPSPSGLIITLVILGALCLFIILAFATSRDKLPIHSASAAVSISELPTVEAYGRLLPKDLLNAFARFIGSSRSLSLDDRVYSFAETRGQGRENQASDYAEYIAESAPLLRIELITKGTARLVLIGTALFGELLILLSATMLYLTMNGYIALVRKAFADVIQQNYPPILELVSDPLLLVGLFVILFARFGSLFREIAFRFLGEVAFQSYMVAISISSSILPGRAEAAAAQPDGLHIFDAGRTSILRIRIQTAQVHTTTMVSGGGGADSLGGPRYIIGAEREDRLMQALGEEAYRYIRERTGAATTRVRSEPVEMKDAAQALVDSGGRAALSGRLGPEAQVRYDLHNSPRLTDKRQKEVDGEYGE
jgi:hypothetical protein